ncbi:MAG: hypothetical protein ACREMY_16230, partial [bacterium]
MTTGQLGTAQSQLGAIEFGALAPEMTITHSFIGQLGTAKSMPGNIMPGYSDAAIVLTLAADLMIDLAPDAVLK